VLPHIPVVHSRKLYYRCSQPLDEPMIDGQEQEIHCLMRMQSIDLTGREQEIEAASASILNEGAENRVTSDSFLIISLPMVSLRRYWKKIC